MLGVKNLGIIHHKKPDSNKPKLYLENLIHEVGDRFQPLDRIPEAGAAVSFKGKKKTNSKDSS